MSSRTSLVLALAALLAAFAAQAQDQNPVLRLMAHETPPKPLAPPGPADWRTPDPQNVLVIDTTKGRILVELAPEIAPATVARIRDLTRRKFYDGLGFFRVVDDFMDQTGDPQNTGTGGSSLPNLAAEFTFRRGSDMPFTVVTSADGSETGFMDGLPVTSQPLQLAAFTADGRVAAHADFCQSVAAMARATAPDSANSQFFLMRQPSASLDENYAAWGEVISGLDVVRAIKVGNPPPAPMDKMLTVRILADIPAAERPKVRVVDTAGPWFAADLARVKADKGADFSICDLNLPSDVK
jgi:peptidylprolyl isomerase